MRRSTCNLLGALVLAISFGDDVSAADRVAVVQFEGGGATGAGKTGQAPGNVPASAFASARFNNWFNAYRNFQTGRRLQTAEAGQVEMATIEIAGGESAEAFEGGIPRSQARQHRPGVGRAISGTGAWFDAGSPFGIKYGYGSGYGYGGYGFNNPYGYGARTGGSGAYGFGFGAYGSVGGQTGERLSALISGPVEDSGRLIGSEAPGLGAPSRLDTAVGGSYGRAGAGARKLGENASVGGE
jgi:hypothetical protein